MRVTLQGMPAPQRASTRPLDRQRTPRPRTLFRFVLGVARVVGWDEGTFAGALDERPAVVGLQVVVVVAQQVAVVDPSVLGLAPFGAVIELEPLRPRAAESGA